MKFSHRWLVIFITFTFFIFAPLELYISKTKYVWYSIYDFGVSIFVIFILSTLILLIADSIISFLVHRRCKKADMEDRLAVIIFFCFFSLYIQGNFVQFHYGLLNGERIDWTKYTRQGVISTAVFVLIILLGVILVKKLGITTTIGIARVIAICTIMTEAVTLIILGINADILDKKITRVSTCDKEFVYSANENFIVIMLDKFDSRLLDDMLSGVDGDYCRSTFENFTFYDNTTSMYQMTNFSFPQIVADSRYLCEEPFYDYLENAFDDSYLLSALSDLGYDVNIYTTQDLPHKAVPVDNWIQVRYQPVSDVKLLGFMYRLIGFRYMPQPLKDVFWFYPDDINNIKKIVPVEAGYDNDDPRLYEWFNSTFNEKLLTSEFEITDTPGSFHMYHLKGMHPALKWNRDFSTSETIVSEEETALSLLDMLNRYFDKLKEVGLYDDADIIVMADHGDGSYTDEGLGHLPIFLYKETGSRHPLTVNNEPHSYAELNRLYSMILHDNMADYISYDDSERFVYDIEWAETSTEATDSVAGFVKKYVIGDSTSPENYHYSGEKYMLGEYDSR